jgi:hypothetical protein
VPSLLVGHFHRRQFPKFFIHQRQQLFGRLPIPSLNPLQDLGDIAHRGVTDQLYTRIVNALKLPSFVAFVSTRPVLSNQFKKRQGTAQSKMLARKWAPPFGEAFQLPRKHIPIWSSPRSGGDVLVNDKAYSPCGWCALVKVKGFDKDSLLERVQL